MTRDSSRTAICHDAASAGAVFGLPILEAADLRRELIELPQRAGVELVGAVLDAAAQSLPEFRAKCRTVLLFGSEADGLHPRFSSICDALVSIPMRGCSDSLNVGVAAAVVLRHLSMVAD